MRKIIITIIVITLVVSVILCSVASADKGVVVAGNGNKYAISYNLGFLLVEWYGGHVPYKGDVYVGNFSGYGMKKLYCLNADSETRFWIEDFMASEDDAWEFLYD